jgi:hypothetical protein
MGETLETWIAKPIPKGFYKRFFLIVGLLLIFAVGFYGVLKVDDRVTEQRVQQTLDTYCGQGTVSAKDGFYSYDPQFRWESKNASCYSDIVSGEFTCHCPAAP